jgi:Na+/melibiose symporter-like transporter
VIASRRALAAYGALRMPLAFLELPLFVLLPNLYGGTYGMSLAVVGALLFGVRLLDALADPWIGSTIDRHRRRFGPRRWIAAGLPFLCAGFAAMLLPPVEGAALAFWLAVTSMITYLAYSSVSIAYQAWGAEIGGTPAERARVTATRETFGLVGVLGASALLTPDQAPMLSVIFTIVAIVCALAMRAAPAPLTGAATDDAGKSGWRETIGRPACRWLLAAFVTNGIATAIPATLVLFFVRDVLASDDRTATLFLVSYFLAGALGMPLWVAAARRIGLRNAWLLGMSCSVLAFLGALGLGAGDTAGFLAVCLLTGLALGSDLAMPAALLATVISQAGHSGSREGRYFGAWNLATKLSLAAAAGLALPLLELLGYSPGSKDRTFELTLVYAALPCALKIVAGILLALAPLPDTTNRPLALEGTDR